MNNKGADQTARMCRLICTFVVRILHKTHFRLTWPTWALSRENLSLGFATRVDSNRSAQLETSYSLEISAIESVRYYTTQAMNNKGADQTARMRRLICTFVVRIWQKQIFSWCGSYGSGFENFLSFVRIISNCTTKPKNDVHPKKIKSPHR